MNITERIKAVYVMQRFVRMSRMLLPNFSELMSKEGLTTVEEQKVERIQAVYESFQVNPELSVRLINSNIFQLIMEVYDTTAKNSGQSPKTFYIYDEFLKESDRLINAWDRHQLN